MKIHKKHLIIFGASKIEIISTSRSFWFKRLQKFEWGGNEVINILNLK